MMPATHRDIGTTPSRGFVPYVPCPGTGDMVGHVPNVPYVPLPSVIGRSATPRGSGCASIDILQCRKAIATEFKQRLRHSPRFRNTFTLVFRWIADRRLAFNPSRTHRLARRHAEDEVVAIAVLDVSTTPFDTRFSLTHCVHRLLESALCLSLPHVCRARDEGQGSRSTATATLRARFWTFHPGLGHITAIPRPPDASRMARKILGSCLARTTPRGQRDCEPFLGANTHRGRTA